MRLENKLFRAARHTQSSQSPYSPALTSVIASYSSGSCRTSAKEFESHIDLQAAALQWGQQLSKDSLHREVQRPVDHCQDAIDSGGDHLTE